MADQAPLPGDPDGCSAGGTTWMPGLVYPDVTPFLRAPLPPAPTSSWREHKSVADETLDPATITLVVEALRSTDVGHL